MLNVVDPQLPRGHAVRCENVRDGGRRYCAHVSNKEAGPWVPGGGHRRGRRLPGRDRSREVPACLTGTEIFSVRVRDDVLLDKRDVSYYSFHIYSGFTAGGAAAPGQGSSG